MGRRREQFKGRQFTAEMILWAVLWYLLFSICYRDLELMLQDRGVSVSVREQIESFESVSDSPLNPLRLLPFCLPYTVLGYPDVDQGEPRSLRPQRAAL